MNIKWTKTEYYEWTGISDDHEYILSVFKMTDNSQWEWKVFGGSGEYGLLYSQYDEYDAKQAKQKATQALINYLKEKTTA